MESSVAGRRWFGPNAVPRAPGRRSGTWGGSSGRAGWQCSRNKRMYRYLCMVPAAGSRCNAAIPPGRTQVVDAADHERRQFQFPAASIRGCALPSWGTERCRTPGSAADWLARGCAAVLACQRRLGRRYVARQPPVTSDRPEPDGWASAFYCNAHLGIRQAGIQKAGALHWWQTVAWATATGGRGQRIRPPVAVAQAPLGRRRAGTSVSSRWPGLCESGPRQPFQSIRA